MSYEPNIAPGDWNEHVTLLQERLKHLGYYEGSVDGQYGQATETAVQQLQEAAGLEQDAQVQKATWDAIERQELLHGSAYQPQETAAPSSADTAERQLSEDGKWWWDGVDWRSVDGQEAADAGSSQASGQAELQLSPDGQWQWDGAQWLAASGGNVDAAPQFQQAALGFGGGPGVAGQGLTTASTADALTGFEKDLADLLPEHIQVLDGIVENLNAHPLVGGSIMLTGGTDRPGDKDYNKRLGQNRAEAVLQYLQARVTDEETRQAIKAYSLGEPDEGPEVDDPNLRRVDIKITRRTIELPKPHPTDPLPKKRDLGPAWHEKEENRVPKPGRPKPDPKHPEWPDWFWKEVEKWPPRPSFIAELSTLINQTLGTHGIARAARRIAEAFHLNGADVERTLDAAFQSGGEEGVKELLKAIIEKGAGDEVKPQPSPYGPGLKLDPVPDPQLKPEIRF